MSRKGTRWNFSVFEGEKASQPLHKNWKASGVRYWKAWPGDFIWLERKSQMNQELRDNSYHNFLEIVCIEGRITKKSPEGVWAFKFGIKEESVMEMKDQRERQEDI